jgi:hypothetical protein
MHVIATWMCPDTGRRRAMRSDGVVYVWTGSHWQHAREYGSDRRDPCLPVPGCENP